MKILVGLTVTAALTDYMSLTTYRGDHSKSIVLVDGELTEYPIKKLKKSRHGLTVSLIPSEKYLGEIHLTNDIVEDFIRHMSYIIPEGISIHLTLENENDKLRTNTYKSIGLSANLEYLSSSLEFSPIELKCITDDFDITMSFSYDKTVDDMIYESYANYVVTTEGGTHEIAAQKAICDYFTKEAKRQDPNSKYEVGYDDCKKGLVFVVNVEHVKPEFEGQHKTKFSNKDVATVGRKVLYDALFNYLSVNRGLLKKCVTYLRQISKIRQEAHKIKGVSNKKPSTFLDDAEIKGFHNISDRKYTGYKELYIAEGDSAVSALLSCRNPKNQALFGIMGVIDNTFGIPLSKLLQKPTFRNLIKILGCGIGKEFDINKLRFNKIIITSDKDTDGDNITSLLLCFFYVFMPELIIHGKIYKAMPPLYLLDKKSLKKYYNGREWLYDKVEYYNIYNTIIANNCELALEEPGREKNVIPLNKKAKMDWLILNSEYTLELANLSKKATCDETILEYVCWYKVLSRGDAREFKMMIEKEFPEMIYDLSNQSLIGSWNGNYFSLICDRLFMKSANRFINLLVQNPSLFVYCGNKNVDMDMERMTIGTFFKTMYTNYDIKIEQRFKGKLILMPLVFSNECELQVNCR